MVKAIVDIDEKADKVINLVKAKENLKDKSDAINMIIELYGKEMFESELRSEFVKELLESQKEKTIKIKDFESSYK